MSDHLPQPEQRDRFDKQFERLSKVPIQPAPRRDGPPQTPDSIAQARACRDAERVRAVAGILASFDDVELWRASPRVVAHYLDVARVACNTAPHWAQKGRTDL